MAEFKVKKEDDKRRLDLFLKFNLPKYSRSSLRKILDGGKVKLNEEVEYRPNYRVAEGDVVNIDTENAISRVHLRPYDFPVEVIYKDDDLLVVNKPKGIKVHPTGQNDTDSLLNALYFMFSEELTDYGITLINRIDKSTSGLVLLALSARGAWHYSRQFSQSEVSKYYLAGVYGGWDSKYGNQEVVQHNFLSYSHVERRQSVTKDTGEFAHTVFQLIGSSVDKKAHILKAKPVTGRTHQIRVQLAHIGFPIIGDKKYGGRLAKRLMLHAYRLRLKDTKGVEKEFEAPVPKEFSALVEEGL